MKTEENDDEEMEIEMEDEDDGKCSFSLAWKHAHGV